MKNRIIRKMYDNFTMLLPDKLFLKLKFRYLLGYNLDLYNPRTFNEKIQWLKLYDRKKEYTQMADKFEVRKYIEKKIGKEYLIPLLGVYDTYDEIDFDVLPEQFVLKPNHTSGDIFICLNKQDIDKSALKIEINEWLNRKYYWLHREWPYKNIKSRIICEKYIADESETGLKDYKIMCFNGKAKLFYVCLNRRSSTGLNVNIYNLDWTLMPFRVLNYDNSDTFIPKPRNFEKMVLFAERLSKDIPFIRVDFFEVSSQLYFGELTFYPGAGFERFTDKSIDYLLGSWLELPKK